MRAWRRMCQATICLSTIFRFGYARGEIGMSDNVIIGPAACPSASTSAKGGFLSRLGPGLITGASDDDPSGIATYSQAGAQFGYGLGWVLFSSWPLMCAIQEISARIGRVTGRGIAGVIRRHYPAPVLYVLMLMLIVANVINLGADLGAMGAALQLVI